MKATLLLSDKTRWKGIAFGSPGIAMGHICFHDGDYMQPLGDPAYANQLLTLSTPLAGACGVNVENCESGKPFLSGVIATDVCGTPSHWRSAESLDYFLKRHYITGICGVDLVKLRKHIEDNGVMRGAICTTPGFNGWNALLAKLNDNTMRGMYPGAIKEPILYNPHGIARFFDSSDTSSIGVIDLGAAQSLTKQFCRRGLRVTLLPPVGEWNTAAYSAIVLSHGAREDGHDVNLVAKIRAAANPIYAVGNGFSLLCAALDLPMVKAGLGMHSDDLPIVETASGRIIPTAHNHRLSLPISAVASRDDITVTHTTCDGLFCVGFKVECKNIWAEQFYQLK